MGFISAAMRRRPVSLNAPRRRSPSVISRASAITSVAQSSQTRLSGGCRGFCSMINPASAGVQKTSRIHRSQPSPRERDRTNRTQIMLARWLLSPSMKPVVRHSASCDSMPMQSTRPGVGDLADIGSQGQDWAGVLLSIPFIALHRQAVFAASGIARKVIVAGANV
jgi:hypothetical protein